MILCPTLLPRSAAEARALLAVHCRRRDPVELRVDGIQHPEPVSMLSGKRPPVIVTNRRVLEGGLFHGTMPEQWKILSDALRAGAEFIDVEFSWGLELIRELQSIAGKAKVIVSYHNRQRTPSGLHRLYATMRRTNADVIKIATFAERIEDNGPMFTLLERAKRDRTTMIGICMGPRGEISRVLGGKFGAYLMYAPPDQGEPTAEGQIGFGTLDRVYRAGRISSRTKVFGLVGNPVSYSRGYLFHNERFRKHGTDAVYVNFLVDNLAGFLDSVGGIATGLSVTMPFKRAMLDCIDSADEACRAVASVNTVIRKRGRLHGFNTDLQAMIELLRHRTGLRGKSVIVLGTGGTSRTMAYAAATLGARVTIAGRDRRKARSLAIEFGCDVASIGDLNSVRCDVVLNGTSVGMTGNPVHSIVPPSLIRRGMIVMDAVYSPDITPLLALARHKGAKVITGRELFERQALLQSQRFLSVCT